MLQIMLLLHMQIRCYFNKICDKGKYFTLNSLSYHFSPFENENYHLFIIVLHFASLSFDLTFPYATDLTSDQPLEVK